MALDPWYVTGFVDGEGAFTFSRSGRQISVYFAVKLAGADRPMLEALQQFFDGIGRLYTVGGNGSGGGTRTSSYYRVTRRADLLRVVQHFDRYPLRTQKRSQYAIWRQMVVLKQEFRRPDRTALEELARALSACTTGTPER